MGEMAILMNSNAEYGNVTYVRDQIAETGSSDISPIPPIVSLDRRKFSPRGEASQLLWLYLFIASMAALFMCHSIVADTCETIVARKTPSTWSKETSELINTFRLVLAISYAFIFASHSTMLTKRWTLFRFIGDRVRPDDEWTVKSPPLVMRSFGTILMSCAAINVYLLLLQLGLLLLQLQLDRTDSPIAPILGHRIFSSTLCYAAFFLYAYQTFDIRTNIAILICVACISILSLSGLLYGVFLVWTSIQYFHLCPYPSEPVRTVSEPSSQTILATNASTFQSHIPLLNPSLVGGNVSPVPGGSTNKSIAIAECVFLGCFCILLSNALSISSAVPLLQYTDEATQMVFGRVDGLHAIVGLFIAWGHILMICSYKSVITQENTVIRFINDNTSVNKDTRADGTSRSTMPVWLSLIAMGLYTYALGLVLSALFINADFTRRVPSIVSKPTISLLFIAGLFFYTYRVFDLRTSMMIATVIALLITTIALEGRSPPDRIDAVGYLAVNCLIENYNYLCCTPLDSSSAIYGCYAPPLFTSQTGTGLDLEVGEVQDAPIYERSSVTFSDSTHDAQDTYTLLKESGGGEDAGGSRQYLDHLLYNVHFSART